MKINFNVVPFKADLLIDNRGKSGVLKKKGQEIQDDFRHATNDNEDEFLILISRKNQDKDMFRLYNTSSNTMVSYQSRFSKLLDKTTYENAFERLLNIYKLMRIKASHVRIIDNYRKEKVEHTAKLNEALNDSEMNPKDKKAFVSVQEALIKSCDEGIRHESIALKTDSDSFELAHNLNDELK